MQKGNQVLALLLWLVLKDLLQEPLPARCRCIQGTPLGWDGRLEGVIAFQVRMSFAAVTLKRQWIDGHVVLARRLESPRFRRIETISPRNHVHAFQLTCLKDTEDEWLAMLARLIELVKDINAES